MIFLFFIIFVILIFVFFPFGIDKFLKKKLTKKFFYKPENKELELNPDIKASTNVITKKAIGEKCPVCWKIFDKKCERHNCGFDGKKK